MASLKQAVVLIHGMGEQKPMETLRGFVDAVWKTHTEIHDPNVYPSDGVWSKPDRLSDNFELRRLTTVQNRGGLRTDFFEFYWAHLMTGTTLSHVTAWVRSLIWRDPRTLPRQLMSLYFLVVVGLLIALGFFINGLFRADVPGQGLSAWLSTLIGVVIIPILGGIIKTVVGDAARYLNPSPANVESRHEIRSAGVKLLKALHERDYVRIIVVGHSLGTVIGYDILTHSWADFHNQVDVSGQQKTEHLETLEQIARDLEDRKDVGIAEIQLAQRRYLEELQANGGTWRVTDFVTLGSPLAHAEVLMAKNAKDLYRRKQDRELPTCLPVLEVRKRKDQFEGCFSFEAGKYRLPHHAAVFAPTRWTNLYYPSRWILWGDFIAGPLSKVLGEGIRDVEVQTTQRGGLLSHDLYWGVGRFTGDVEHIRKLRDALDLTDDALRGGVPYDTADLGSIA